MDPGDKQRFIDAYPALAAHPLLAALLEQSDSLVMAQAQARIAETGDVHAIRAYGEFLYLTGYPPHPGNSEDLHVYAVNETVETVKRLALEQWSHLLPEGFAGAVWLHPPSGEERARGVCQVWQVAVYTSYGNALHHNIANRLSVFDGEYWNSERSSWYMDRVGQSPEHCDSFIALDGDGFLRVTTNYQGDWSCPDHLQGEPAIRPHAPVRATEPARPRPAS